jgi:guanylate kinase
LAQNTPSTSAMSETFPSDHDARLGQLYAEGNALITDIRKGNKPRVFIISGPSGVGKDSVIESLRNVFTDAQYVVTATTRPMRPGEIDGVHYIFLSKEEFLDRIEKNDFIENALVYDNHYGVPRSPIVQGLEQGRDVIIKVDVKGAATLRRLIPNTISLFLCPESMPALLSRLRDRKTDNPAVLMKRFTTATAELEEAWNFDYVVFNEDGKLDGAVEQICSIVSVEHRKVHQPDIEIP